MTASMLGVLGGTFDPIHRGHLHLARQLLERLPRLSQVQLMPCAEPVHRDSPLAPADARREMLELAVADEPAIAVNPLELDRGGASYSVDSLRQLRAERSETLVLILGSDTFNQFLSWKQPDEILALANVVVCYRPGHTPDAVLYPEHRVADAEQLAAREAGAILALEVDAPDCASTRLRAQIARGENPGDCLPGAIASYIERNHLYRTRDD